MKFIPSTCILLTSTLFILFTCTIRCVPNGYQLSITECNATPTIHEIMNHNHFSEVFSSFSELHKRSEVWFRLWIEGHELKNMNCDSRFSLKTVPTQFSRSSLRIFELDTRLDSIGWTLSSGQKAFKKNKADQLKISETFIITLCHTWSSTTFMHVMHFINHADKVPSWSYINNV